MLIASQDQMYELKWTTIAADRNTVNHYAEFDFRLRIYYWVNARWFYLLLCLKGLRIV